MSELVSYVDAVFDGKKIRMRIDRDKFPAFESIVRQAIYQTFTKFAAGLWTSTDLTATLAFASIDWNAPESRMARQHLSLHKSVEKMFLAEQRMAFQMPQGAVKRVENLLVQKAPAPYATLATMILEAALFGIPAKDAVFDESAPQAAPLEESA